MKELFDHILKYLPRYFADFGAALAGPKSFIAARVRAETGDAFGEALLFLGISLALVVLMYAPLIPAEKDFWSVAGPHFVHYLFKLPLTAVVTWAAWWIVGGRAPVGPFFVAYAYLLGIASVLLAAIDLISNGFFKAFDPQLFSEYWNATRIARKVPDWEKTYADLLRRYDESNVAFITAIIGEVGRLILTIWTLIVGWGVFRQLTGLSKLRSLAALIVSQGLIYSLLRTNTC